MIPAITGSVSVSLPLVVIDVDLLVVVVVDIVDALLLVVLIVIVLLVDVIVLIVVDALLEVVVLKVELVVELIVTPAAAVRPSSHHTAEAPSVPTCHPSGIPVIAEMTPVWILVTGSGYVLYATATPTYPSEAQLTRV